MDGRSRDRLYISVKKIKLDIQIGYSSRSGDVVELRCGRVNSAR